MNSHSIATKAKRKWNLSNNELLGATLDYIDSVSTTEDFAMFLEKFAEDLHDCDDDEE